MGRRKSGWVRNVGGLPGLLAIMAWVSLFGCKPDFDPRKATYACGDDQPCAEVKIVLKDGRVIEETATSVRGDAANPVTHQQLIEKFMFITQDNLDKETAHSVVKTIDCLETLSDVNELTSLLSGQALGGQNGN